MRALIRDAYGPPDVLRVEVLPTPEPGPGELRIRVRAVAVNRGDWELLTGNPRFIAALAGLFVRRSRHLPPGPRGAPKFRVLGYDLAGEVDALGPGVTRFQLGERVFGESGSSGFGAFAEHVCVPERARVVALPEGVSFEQAAALPEAGSIALQAFRKLAPLRPGMRVLVNGAGGGGGTIAVQLARRAGAEVTAVDAAEKHELLRSLGAAHVVDYRTEDYTSHGGRYDVVLDLAAHRSVRESRRALAKDGVYLMAGGGGLATFQAAVLGVPLSWLGPGRIRFLMADESREGLEELAALVAQGELRPVVERSYPLDETPEALRRIGAGEVLGKLVVRP